MAKKKAEEIYLDRFLFMKWFDGILMDFKHGKGFCADLAEFDRAEEVMDAGGTVFLTVEGKPVTKMIDTGEAYEEIKL